MKIDTGGFFAGLRKAIHRRDGKEIEWRLHELRRNIGRVDALEDEIKGLRARLQVAEGGEGDG